MLGRDVPHTVVPYFYSVLADLGELEYVGPAYDWDEEIVRGSIEDGNFTNWYLKDGTCRGRAHVRALGRPRPRAAAARREQAACSTTQARARLGDSPTPTLEPSATRRE